MALNAICSTGAMIFFIQKWLLHDNEGYVGGLHLMGSNPDRRILPVEAESLVRPEIKGLWDKNIISNCNLDPSS